MKTLIAALAAAALLPAAARAQSTSGTVRFQETIYLNATLEGEAAQFAALLPKEQKRDHILYFTPEASTFRSAPKAESDAPEPGPGSGLQIRMDAPEETYYSNLRDGQGVAAREFFGRRFLVSGAADKPRWRMTGRQKSILSYTCQEAVLYGEHDTTTAWFTTAIPVSTGPRGLHGLPGLILEASDGGHSLITASAVTPGLVPAGAIAVPKGGKKVSDQQFKSIVDAKLAELGASGGQSGNQVIIKVRHN